MRRTQELQYFLDVMYYLSARVMYYFSTAAMYYFSAGNQTTLKGDLEKLISSLMEIGRNVNGRGRASALQKTKKKNAGGSTEPLNEPKRRILPYVPTRGGCTQKHRHTDTQTHTSLEIREKRPLIAICHLVPLEPRKLDMAV